MRIAYVCTDPGVPVFGRKGGSIHVREVLRGLVRRGAEITVLARRTGGDPPPDLRTVRVRRLARAPSGQTPERERFLLRANEELRSQLEELPALDMVYERHALWSFAAMEHARSRGIPGLLEVNAPLVQEQRRFRTLHTPEDASRAADRCFAAATAILAVSEPLGAWLEGMASARSRVHVVPNGVDTGRFARRGAPRTPDDGSVVTIGFVGSLRPWHGVEHLVDAFARLEAERLPARLVIVGDGGGRGAIEQRCAGLRGPVELTGAVDPDEIPAVLASIDVAVAPYPALEEFYFSPLKLYEYLAAGCAVVASAAGQVRRVIRDGENGLLYPPGDVDALAAALRRLVLDADLRARLGANARLAAERDHRWDDVVSTILSLAGAPEGAVA